MKDPRFLTFRPAFHWTDQKLRVHAFCCVLALLIATLLRRRLTRVGIHLSIARMLEKLTAIREVSLLFPGPSQAAKPLARTVLSDLDPEQQAILEALDLARYRIR